MSTPPSNGSASSIPGPGSGQPVSGVPAHRVYYDASQLRSDLWSRIAAATTQLREIAARSSERASSPESTEPTEEITRCLAELAEIERFWSFPGPGSVDRLRALLKSKRSEALDRLTQRLSRSQALGHDADQQWPGEEDDESGSQNQFGPEATGPSGRARRGQPEARARFCVLLVGDASADEAGLHREQLLRMRSDDDPFVYTTVSVPSIEDAAIAVLFNHTIQSVVIRSGLRRASECKNPVLRRYLEQIAPPMREELEATAKGKASMQGDSLAFLLARVLRSLRPELDLFLVSDAALDERAGTIGELFRRVFYRFRDVRDLHQSLLKGVQERFETPFFDALRRYSKRPTGVFHALPISRASTIVGSRWIGDMLEFYGENIFLAETSATTGGLDSLLQPHGSLKRAQGLCARAFGAKRTFMVTNGTSTANKIVMQALVKPGDIVLVSRDCHKSHHYSLILCGAQPIYLDPYPLHPVSMFGGVSLQAIKSALLALRRERKLDRVRMLLLTNCTFDGITYDPLRVMREVLAIKPDMVFVWDEAWFAYARCSPTLRQRTAMHAADALADELRAPDAPRRYAHWAEGLGIDALDDQTLASTPLRPDPHVAKVRVYATQSTHKTLTSLRQGSMIHVHDEDFQRLTRDNFDEAYMTHTSTSPNYQILASMDVGRRQVELEGYELVQRQMELAMTVRQKVLASPLLRRHFRIMGARDLVPEQHRPSGLQYYWTAENGWAEMERAWRIDEFTVDPTRITLHVGLSGMDGDTFKKLLIDEHDIQINKTSRNTVLFMLNIGSTRSTAVYLVEVLASIARAMDRQAMDRDAPAESAHTAKVRSLTEQVPPLPLFSRFHDVFRPDPRSATSEADIRRAYFLSSEEHACEFLKLDGTIARALADGREVTSACFVTPYPPGFPVLVPGQVVSSEILAYLKALDVKEIHGYDPERGLRVFTEATLRQIATARESEARLGDPAAAHASAQAAAAHTTTKPDKLQAPVASRSGS